MIPPEVMGQNGQTRCVRFPSPGTKRTNTVNVFYSRVVGQNGQKKLCVIPQSWDKMDKQSCLVFQVRPMYLPTSEAFHIGSSKQSGQNFKGYIKVCIYTWPVCSALITAAKINPFSAAWGLCTVSSGSS